jgi:hypothetical protein
MNAAPVVVTKRQDGSPERHHPLMGRQAIPKLRAQVKNLSRGERAHRQVKANHQWARIKGLSLHQNHIAHTPEK